MNTNKIKEFSCKFPLTKDKELNFNFIKELDEASLIFSNGKTQKYIDTISLLLDFLKEDLSSKNKIKDTYENIRDKYINLSKLNKGISLKNFVLHKSFLSTHSLHDTSLLDDVTFFSGKNSEKVKDENDTAILPKKSQPANATFNFDDIYEKLKYRIHSNNTIKIPKNTNIVLKDEIEISEFRKIHNDIHVAKELCLLFLSQFTGTLSLFNKYKDNDFKHRIHFNIKKQKSLYGRKGNRERYTIIATVLINAGILHTSVMYSSMHNIAKEYWLDDKYRINGDFRSYKLKEKKVVKVKNKLEIIKLNEAMGNTIAKSTLIMYSKSTLPTVEHLLSKATVMVKNKASKKGLMYKKRNGKSKKLDKTNCRYIEDDIKIFNYLTSPSYFIPAISKKGGGRVSHSFNLMPTWIREEIKLNDEDMVEIDFSALHPNIASAIYGKGQEIDHSDVAVNLGLTRKEVKTEHLSFFNKGLYGMRESILWKYYNDNHKYMLNNIIYDKESKGKLATTIKLFTIEVKIMTRITEKLLINGIASLYVYDALYVTKDDAEYTLKVMKDVINEFNIPSRPVINYDKKF